MAGHNITEGDRRPAQGTAYGKGGVSQETVYEDTGIHIGKIETEKYNITVSTLARLCRYYGISLGAFFDQVEDRSDAE
ncbi:MAG: helix-turn-helix transcriptional regulator [Alistipes onderdonkii]